MSSPPTIGVLMTALGTPDAPTPGALRPYLRQFLGDRRVVDLDPFWWWILLNGVVLPFRPRKSAALYRNIWTEKGSPLLFHSRAQAEGLAERLGAGFAVELGMRYGNPSAEGALVRLIERGLERIVVLPMFPQYSCATTASVLDETARVLLDRRNVPSWRVVRSYPDDPGFVSASARIARSTLGDSLSTRHVVFSFHGIPVRFVSEGDPYQEECERTAVALAQALDLPKEQWTLAYQSKFGREEWLGPATDDVLERLATSGTGRVAVMCPAFTADCLETIDEIGRESAHVFREAGGEDFVFVPCVNDDSEWLDSMAELVRREAAGWTS